MQATDQTRYRAAGLKEAIRARGLKQRWIAGQAGISEQLLSHIASGVRTASPVVAERIARAVGLPVNTLFEEQKRSDAAA